MLYLTIQILALLLLALIIGAAIDWLLRGVQDRAAQEAQASADAAHMADLRRDRVAAEAAMAEMKAFQPAADDGKLVELQSALDECRASSKSLTAKRDAAKAALAAKESAAPAVTAVPASPTADASTSAASKAMPVGAVSAAAPPDDLKQISWIGPKLEGLLNEAGILRFKQIAHLTPGQIAEVNDIWNFKGRIERDNWIGQENRFASGKTS
jgi:predicted flap endonuclease-1-like 5' DNA nuclease